MNERENTICFHMPYRKMNKEFNKEVVQQVHTVRAWELVKQHVLATCISGINNNVERDFDQHLQHFCMHGYHSGVAYMPMHVRLILICGYATLFPHKYKEYRYN